MENQEAKLLPSIVPGRNLLGVVSASRVPPTHPALALAPRKASQQALEASKMEPQRGQDPVLGRSWVSFGPPGGHFLEALGKFLLMLGPGPSKITFLTCLWVVLCLVPAIYKLGFPGSPSSGSVWLRFQRFLLRLQFLQFQFRTVQLTVLRFGSDVSCIDKLGMTPMKTVSKRPKAVQPSSSEFVKSRSSGAKMACPKPCP